VIRPHGSKEHEIYVNLRDDDTIVIAYHSWYDLSEPRPERTKEITTLNLFQMLENSEFSENAEVEGYPCYGELKHKVDELEKKCAELEEFKRDLRETIFNPKTKCINFITNQNGPEH